MSDQEEAQPNCAVEMAESGDVFLVVGPEKLELRVQSLILKATSKTFAARLGPNWTKGHEQPSPEKPMEIHLPEDNAVSPKYICAVTHSRSQMIPKDLSAQDILDIAIVADKYFFVDALEMANRSWLRVCDKMKREIWLSWLQHTYFGMRKLSDRLLRLSLWIMLVLTLTFIPRRSKRYWIGA
ncbi:hypothetical protein N7478_004028 [Penicillium angulare]|uniref:uncharacterized protein n=1 Tax=Penicillium angulare TaxID=116970 RepID=UPI0025415A63|nr:uncharacterized protein N7478_004028 [Penicillium angulare]KAJ5278656.1 hypothetical protein N7478_004028 [Penicillium angulare]